MKYHISLFARITQHLQVT